MLQAALVYGLIRHYECDLTLDEPTMEAIKVPPPPGITTLPSPEQTPN